MERFVPGLDVVAREMNRRFRVRCSTGIVSRAILGTLVYQFLQAQTPASANAPPVAELNRDSAMQTPKRGAPPGNRNRLIHGRYARDIQQLRADVRRFVHDALMMTGSKRLP